MMHVKWIGEFPVHSSSQLMVSIIINTNITNIFPDDLGQG